MAFERTASTNEILSSFFCKAVFEYATLTKIGSPNAVKLPSGLEVLYQQFSSQIYTLIQAN